MFLSELLTKGPKLRAAKRSAAKARRCEGAEAESLFQAAYQGYAEVIQGYPLLVDALYHWGFALYHHAQKHSGAHAAALYRDAAAKFEFCLLANPSHLGAAIDWGATLMAWARTQRAAPTDPLYEQAQQQFERANAIQKASASYNLACLHALRGEFDACRHMLEQARDHGSLPDLNEILEDADLAAARQQTWFETFLQSLTPETPSATPELPPTSHDTSPTRAASEDINNAPTGASAVSSAALTQPDASDTNSSTEQATKTAD